MTRCYHEETMGKRRVKGKGEGEREGPQGSNTSLTPMLRYNVSFCTYNGATFDASTTNLSYSIAAPQTLNGSTLPLEVVLSFLSPITPTSTLRQSIPASYFSIHVNGDFDVDIYVDVNGQWVSGDRGSQIVWDLEEHQPPHGRGLKTWKVKRGTELLLSEIADRAEWGTLHFTASSVSTYGHERAAVGLMSVGCATRVRRIWTASAQVRSDGDTAERQ